MVQSHRFQQDMFLNMHHLHTYGVNPTECTETSKQTFVVLEAAVLAIFTVVIQKLVELISKKPYLELSCYPS